MPAKSKTPRRDAAVAIMGNASGVAGGVRASVSAGVLFLALEGEIGKLSADGRSGITAAAVRVALARHPRARNIELEINSRGGDVAESAAIVQALMATGAEIATTARTECSSAAIDILLAGSLRTASADCRMVLHGTESGRRPARWTAAEHAKAAANLKAHDDALIRRLVAVCGGHPAEWRREIATESPMVPVVAQIKGLIHLVEGQSRTPERARALERDFGFNAVAPRIGVPIGIAPRSEARFLAGAAGAGLPIGVAPRSAGRFRPVAFKR